MSTDLAMFVDLIRRSLSGNQDVALIDESADPRSARCRQFRIVFCDGAVVNVRVTERPQPFGFQVVMSREIAPAAAEA